MTERTLLVSLDDTVVGHLWGDGVYTLFSFHQLYLDMPDRPVLGQYFEDRLQKTTRRTRGMHPWFENLLPEQAGALRKHYSRILGLDANDSMGLLAALGHDLPGAVRVYSDTGDPPVAEVIDEDQPDPLGTVRFSLGGMQLKFSLSGEPSRLSLRVADDAGAAWILKLGTPEYPGLAENEHAIMSWCRASGFDVPETLVVPVGQLPDLGAIPDTSTGYLIRRYDREPGRRIHQEDFAQVLNAPPERKFEATDAAGLASLAHQILGAPGAEEALRRLTVMIATGNCDAHLKNWSLVYPDGVNAAWSPLYDQVCTVAYPRHGKKLPLRIGTAHQHVHQVERSHLRWVGKKAGLDGARCDEVVDATLIEMARALPSLEEMPSQLLEVLERHWATVPVLRDVGLAQSR